MKKVSLFYYVFSFVLLVVFIVLIITAYSNLSDSIANTSQDTQNRPVIVIDAGHGGEDGGAVANNVIEKDINLKIAQDLSDMLISNGFEVVMTRRDDKSINTSGETLRERKVSDMKNRLKIFDSSNNNVVVSIHQNKFTDSKYSGTQIFYSPNNADSALLAESIRESVVTLIQPQNDRACKQAGNEIYLLYNTKSPAVIVECGFLSNKNESNLLNNNDYQKQVAWSIFFGILSYINI